jgi:hypothetical protein
MAIERKERSRSMLVITRYRPAGPLHNLSALLDELAQLKHSMEGETYRHDAPKILLNEAQTEVIIINSIATFAELDQIEANHDNTRFGLRLFKAGLVLCGTEFWRDIPGHLPHYQQVYSTL